jgi:hypothetical protein
MDGIPSRRIIDDAFLLLFNVTNENSARLGNRQISPATLRKAFHEKAKEFHPDRARALGTDEKMLEASFKNINNAYQILSALVTDNRLYAAFLKSYGPIRVINTKHRNTTGHDTTRGNEFKHRPGSSYAEDLIFAREYYKRHHKASFYYAGSIPRKKLRIGQFLFYNKIIDWMTLINAITWQASVRPKLGEIGMAFKYLDFDAILSIIRHSMAGETFGQTALRIAALTPSQLITLLGYQNGLGYPIGKFFVECNILSEIELAKWLKKMYFHNHIMEGGNPATSSTAGLKKRFR